MKIDLQLRLPPLITLIFSVLSCNLLLPVHAAETGKKPASLKAEPALTLEELMLQSKRAFKAGEWKSAAEYCITLLRDYGDRAEIAPLAKRFQLILLQCHLRLNEWKEALPLFETAMGSLCNAPRTLQGEFLLQKANCELQLAQYRAASESVTASLSLLPATGQSRADATLLLAACMLESSDAEGAGKIVAKSLSTLPEPCKEKAVMLGMQAFLKARQPHRACTLLLTALAGSREAVARIGIQLLLLEAASASLELGEPKTALTALARIHPPEKLLTWQRQRITNILTPTTAVPASGETPAESTGFKNSDVTPLECEINALGSGASFSEAARLLLASAHRALNRHHEAALILEDAVSPPASSETLEAASLESAKTWFGLERWDRVIDSANRFAKAYPASKHAPLMLYLKGCAAQKAGVFGEALTTFQSLAKTDTQEIAVKASFMHGLTLLLDNRIPESVQGFTSFLQNHRRHSLAEPTAYLLCIAKGRQGPPRSLRAAACAYLESFPQGEHRPVVLLKRAQASSALKDNAAAVADLEALVAETPGHTCTGEALLLLGDCRLSLGDAQGALAAWHNVPAEQVEAKEEGLLKCAKLLYQGEKFAALRECLGEFDSARNDSRRAADAAGWLWKACERNGHPEEAATWALERIESHGNNPRSKGVDLLLSRVCSLATKDRKNNVWPAKIEALLASSQTDGHHTLHSRLVWADACALRSQNPTEAGWRFIKAATLHPANTTSPAVLADGADALETAGKTAEAADLWRELLKWHPDAPQLDRALCALARLNCEAGRKASALHWVSRFEKTAPTSPLLPRLLLVKATLQTDQGRPAQALETLDQLLRERNAAPAARAEALFRMGQLHKVAGSLRVAISYLQRTYVSYSRFQPWASKAYIASAEVFEALGDHTAACNTYQEFLDSGPPQESPDLALAALRLRSLREKP